VIKMLKKKGMVEPYEKYKERERHWDLRSQNKYELERSVTHVADATVRVIPTTE
jgi:hypothetical protein